MTHAEYEKYKRHKNRLNGTSHYSVEYPEFGELLVMLFKFLAEFFASKFQGISLAKSENENSNVLAAKKQNDEPIDPEVDDLLSGFTPARTFTTMHAATKPLTQLPVEVLAGHERGGKSRFSP